VPPLPPDHHSSVSAGLGFSPGSEATSAIDLVLFSPATRPAPVVLPAASGTDVPSLAAHSRRLAARGMWAGRVRGSDGVAVLEDEYRVVASGLLMFRWLESIFLFVFSDPPAPAASGTGVPSLAAHSRRLAARGLWASSLMARCAIDCADAYRGLYPVSVFAAIAIPCVWRRLSMKKGACRCAVGGMGSTAVGRRAVAVLCRDLPRSRAPAASTPVPPAVQRHATTLRSIRG